MIGLLRSGCIQVRAGTEGQHEQVKSSSLSWGALYVPRSAGDAEPSGLKNINYVYDKNNGKEVVCSYVGNK